MRNSKNKRCFFIFVLAAFLLADGGQVRAEGDAEIQGYSCWENQGIDVQMEASESSGVSVRIDTALIREDYGYSVITGTLRDCQAGNGFGITLKVESKQPAYLMFQLQDQNKNTVRLKENALVIMEEKKQADLLPTGQLVAAGELSETMTIPFESLEASDAFDWEHIDNYSIGITQEKNSVVTLEIDDFLWYGTDEEIPYRLDGASFQGEGEVELPVHGEAIAFYTMDSQDYRFKSFAREGISFDETGKLTVTEKAAVQELTLEAENKEGMTLRRKVELVLPLRSTVDYISAFPAPDEIDEVHIFMEQADREAVINGIRAAGILAAVIILAAFAYYHKKGEEK